MNMDMHEKRKEAYKIANQLITKFVTSSVGDVAMALEEILEERDKTLLEEKDKVISRLESEVTQTKETFFKAFPEYREPFQGDSSILLMENVVYYHRSKKEELESVRRVFFRELPYLDDRRHREFSVPQLMQTVVNMFNQRHNELKAADDAFFEQFPEFKESPKHGALTVKGMIVELAEMYKKAKEQLDLKTGPYERDRKILQDEADELLKKYTAQKAYIQELEKCNEERLQVFNLLGKKYRTLEYFADLSGRVQMLVDWYEKGQRDLESERDSKGRFQKIISFTREMVLSAVDKGALKEDEITEELIAQFCNMYRNQKQLLRVTQNGHEENKKKVKELTEKLEGTTKEVQYLYAQVIEARNRLVNRGFAGVSLEGALENLITRYEELVAQRAVAAPSVPEIKTSGSITDIIRDMRSLADVVRHQGELIQQLLDKNK